MATSFMTAALSRTERERKLQLEAIVARGVNSVRDVFEALEEIRRLRLYRDEYATFRAYCKVKWRLSAVWIRKMLAAEKVRGNVGVSESTLSPGANGQVRPLAALAGLSPADQATAYRAAVALNDGRPPNEAQARSAARATTTLRQRLAAEGLARLEELDEEQLRRECEAELRHKCEDKKGKDYGTVQDKLRHAAKAMRRLGWNDLARECALLAGKAEARHALEVAAAG